MFDYRQLKRFNIDESDLPRERVIINQPTSFYYKYKTRIFVFLSALLGLILIILILFAAYFLCRQVEKKLLAYQAQLKSLTSELALSEEREQRKIAIELHDRISQSLIISKLNLETLRESAPSRELGKNLDDICESLDRTIQNTRSLTVNLSSPVLYELGFEAAVSEWLTEHVEQKHGIRCAFEDDGDGEALSEDIAVILFRMVRELLMNVIEHSHADKARVTIKKNDGYIHITVEDNGIGFERSRIMAAAERKGGLGLFGIRERLEHLNGRLEINSMPLRGTRIKITTPLK
jgi:signal transduction histidine kinase